MSETKLTFSIDEGAHLLSVAIAGTFGKEQMDALTAWTKEVEAAVSKACDKDGQRLNSMVDLTGLESYTSAAALGEMGNLMRENARYIRKTATYGANDLLLAAEEIAALIAHRENFKAFKTKDEALAWIAE